MGTSMGKLRLSKRRLSSSSKALMNFISTYFWFFAIFVATMILIGARLHHIIYRPELTEAQTLLEYRVPYCIAFFIMMSCFLLGGRKWH